MKTLARLRSWALGAAWRYHRNRGSVADEDRVLRRLGHLYEQQGDLAAAIQCFERCHADRELARIHQARGDDREAARRYRELRCYYLAAEAYARAGDWQQAARCFHLSGSFLDAANCWEQWLAAGGLDGLGEEQVGSVLAEVALCYDRLGQTRRAAEQYRRALELLDAAAARHEMDGRHQQSRAAYLAIAHIGHSKGTYESIACGLAGAIRVAKRAGHGEARLLGYYDDFIHYALRFGEYSSAAELCTEAAELLSDPGGTRKYLLWAGESWLRNGDFLYVHLDRAELAESSYHAAIECYLRAREHAELAACYRRLAAVAEPGRRDEFSRLARQLEAEPAQRPGNGHPARRAASQAEPQSRSEAKVAPDPTALLGVAQNAGPDEIRSAYFREIRRHPPDTDTERFEALSQAYDVLADESKRRRYVKLLVKA
jgi:tetratricopeptide (TPR) repeat protein